MKVGWSYVAPGNLIETNKYIASENPEAARKVINDIFEAGNKIKAFPEKGGIVTRTPKGKCKRSILLRIPNYI